MSHPQLEFTPRENIAPLEGETVLAIIRSRSPGSESSEARYIQITIGRRLWAGLVISCLVLLHLILWMVFINFPNSTWLPELVVIGSGSGQSQLLGLWLAISPWALWKRFSVVAAISGLGAWLTSNDWDFVVVVWTLIGAAALVLSIPRIVFGWRMDFQPEQPTSLPSWRSGGTILGMLGYVFVCGLFLAIIQYLAMDYPANSGAGGWLEFLAFILPMTMLNASCTIAVMCPGSRAGKAVAIGVIAAFAAVALAVQQLGTAAEGLQRVVYYALASLPIYAGSLFLLRKLGWRLYQQTPPQAKLPEANLSFDAL